MSSAPFVVPDDPTTPYPVPFDRLLSVVASMGYEVDVLVEGRAAGAVFDGVPVLLSLALNRLNLAADLYLPPRQRSQITSRRQRVIDRTRHPKLHGTELINPRSRLDRCDNRRRAPLAGVAAVSLSHDPQVRLFSLPGPGGA